MILNRVVVEPIAEIIRKILHALDNNLTAADNFGPEGTAGQVLTSNGPNIPPSYQAGGGGGGVTDHGLLTGLADDDHTQYQLRSEENVANGYAGLDANARVPTVRLGSGVADITTFLRGDQSWAVPPGSGGSPNLDGGQYNSIYGGGVAIDGGGP